MHNRKNNFHISQTNICCGYSKEQSQLDGSFERPKHMQNLCTLAHKHQFKILLMERCEIDYLHRLVLTSMWSEKQHHKSARKSI